MFRVRRLILWFGTFIAFINFNFDILYAYKAPFIKGWFVPILAFLIARWTIGILMSFCQMKKNAVASSMREPEPKNKKYTFMEIMLDFFSDFGGLPVMISTGSFRLLSPRDFKYRILIGYAIEMSTSMFPMLIIMLINNGVNEEADTLLQIFCAWLHKVAFLSLLFEFFVLTWEFNYNKQQRARNHPDFQAKTHEQKMVAHGGKIAKISLCAIAGIILLLSLGMYFLDVRSCPETGTVLYWGSCTNCTDEFCGDCEFGPSKCRSCMAGHMKEGGVGKCISCN